MLMMTDLQHDLSWDANPAQCVEVELELHRLHRGTTVACALIMPSEAFEHRMSNIQPCTSSVYCMELYASQLSSKSVGSTYQAFSVAQQGSTIKDIPVASRVTWMFRVARPHRNVQAVQSVIQ